jgi:ribulose-5-phosphate 4-epimerase/fuculose-1-phosphate aldolase
MRVQSKTSIYEPTQADLIFPQMPTFSSFKEERDYIKQHLVGACRMFAKQKFDYGFAGHLTVRDPEHKNYYWTNPMAVPFSAVTISNLILADHEGNVIEGDYAINRAGFVLHAAVHEEHPDIIAMCHAHTIYGTAWAATGRKLDPISQDAAVFFEDHCVIDEDAGKVAVEVEAGSKVSAAFGKYRAAIHRNHGLLTASRHSIDAAAFWFLALERCCQQQLAIEATGIEPVLVSPQKARYSREHVGSEYIGWLHFQPHYQEALSEHPNMLS